MSGIGHNRGPSLAGAGWRRHAWTVARRELLPHMPLNVVRRRVARARALGLDYSTYATVRATTGCDIVGFLFSSNALRLIRVADVLPADRAARLARVERAAQVALMAPHLPLAAPAPLDHAARGPAPQATWRDQRLAARAAIAPLGLSADTVLLIGDAPWEAGWCTAAGLAGYLPEWRYFGKAPA